MSGGLFISTTASLTQTTIGENIYKIDERTQSPEAHLGQLSWLAGRWKTEAWGGICQEIWSIARGQHDANVQILQ